MTLLRNPWFWLKLLAVLNLLDLTSSWPSDYNSNVGVRSSAALTVQVLLALPAVVWLLKSTPAVARRLWNVPIPVVPRVIVFFFVFIELGHIAFQQELYPFSDVGMYTFQTKGWKNRVRLKSRYITRVDGKVIPFSIRRTGDVLFRQDVGFERQLALLYHKYRTNRVIYDKIQAANAAAGQPKLEVARLVMHFEGGRAVIDRVRPVRLVPRGRPPVAQE